MITEFPNDVYWLALASAFLTTWAAAPLWRCWCERTGLMDEPGHRKIHAVPIPLAGGLAVMTGISLPLLLGTVVLHGGWLPPAFTETLSYGLGRRAGQLSTLLLGGIGMLGLGWLDDLRELPPGLKFSGQLLIALLVALSGVRITLFVDQEWFSYSVTVLWILTVTNAINIMDNMNGLCAGLGIIAATFFAVAAALQGQYLVVLLALLTVGSLLGFLPFNFPRAKIFLGDAGSHLVGYLVAVLAILPHFYSARYHEPWAVLDPLFILAVPLSDLAWVVMIRWRLGKPIYQADTNHLSHRLVRRGFSPTLAVLVIWLLATLAGALTLLVRGDCPAGPPS